MKGARVPTRASVSLAELRIAFTALSDSSCTGLPTRDWSGWGQGESGLPQPASSPDLQAGPSPGSLGCQQRVAEMQEAVPTMRGCLLQSLPLCVKPGGKLGE